MATGWGRVGEAIGGMMNAGARDDRVQNQLGKLIARGAAEQRLKQEIMQTGGLEGLGDSLVSLGVDAKQAEGLAGIGRAGLNPSNFTGALGDLLSQGYQREAVDAAKASGKFTDYNAPLIGLRKSPLPTADVRGGNILMDQYSDAPAIFPTEQGQAQIQANQDRGQAALIRANKPAATRSGGSSSGSGKPQTRAQTEAAVLADARAAIAAGADKAAVQQRLRDRGYTKLAGSL